MTAYDWPGLDEEWGICSACGQGSEIRRPVRKFGSQWLCRICAEIAGCVEEEADSGLAARDGV